MQFIVGGVVPDILVLSVGDNVVLDSVPQGQETLLLLGLITHRGVLLVHAHHDILLSTGRNRGRHGLGGMITSKVRFAHVRVIDSDEHGDFFSHCNQPKTRRYSSKKTCRETW